MSKKGFYISPFRALMVFGILTFIGFLFVPRLNVRLNPSKYRSSLTISYNWPNASPRHIDRRIASLIEDAVSTLEGIRQITVRSNEGKGSVEIVPDRFTDMDRLRFEVATKIRQIRSKLPEGASYPHISLQKDEDQNRQNFLIYSVYAPDPGHKIKSIIQDRLLLPLKSLDQIEKINLAGATDLEYVIRFQPELLTELHLRPGDILQAVTRNFHPEDLGIYIDENKAVAVKIQTAKVKGWHIPVAKRGDKIIYLDEIAQVNLQEQRPNFYYRVNGKNAVNIIFTPVSTANTIRLASQINRIIRKSAVNLPEGYHVIKTYDSTTYLRTELHRLIIRSMWVLGVLLAFILLVTFSFRYLLITVISLAVNIGLAILLYRIFNIQIQLYSLAGITISFGLMIDNIIIMLDHLLMHRDRRIFIPVLASTLTTIGALASIFVLSPEVRFNLTDFALVVIINLGVSLVVALWFVPALVKVLRPPKRSWKGLPVKLMKNFSDFYRKLLFVIVQYRTAVIVFFVWAFGIPLFMLPSRVEGDDFWAHLYNHTLGSEWYNEKIRPYADKFLGGSLRLFSQYVFESSFYRQNKETKLHVLASMERGAGIEQMNEVMLQLEDYLRRFPQIKRFVTHVYSGQYAFVEITFMHPDSDFPYVLKSKLIAKSLDWGGMNWEIYGVGKGFVNNNNARSQTNFVIESKSYNLSMLHRWSDTLRKELLTHPRIKEVKYSSYQYPWFRLSKRFVMDPDRERLLLQGLSLDEIYRRLKYRTLSLYPSDYIIRRNRLYPVRLQSALENNFDIWHIMNEPFPSNGGFVRPGLLIRLREEKVPDRIVKKNQNYIQYLHVLYVGSEKFGKQVIAQKIKQVVSQAPLGIIYKLKNRFDFPKEDKVNWLWIILLVMGVIFLISAVLFESYRMALMVIGIIPVSFIGVFLTFYWFDFNFDQGGMAAFVLLSGITVNAVFYILDRFLRLKRKLPAPEALMKAYEELIFPISLTVISTVLGFVPFVVKGQHEVFWFALGVGTIGGMIFSFLTLFIYMPVVVLKNVK